MDWLLENSLANMYGPTFLLLYACVIAITLFVCWLRVQPDSTSYRALPPLPQQPDPYEIAYLRGGENEVLRLAIFSLLQRGYLQMDAAASLGTSRQRLSQTDAAPPASALSPLERQVMAAFSTPREAKDLFQSTLPDRIAAHCAGYAQKLQVERLLLSPEENARRWQTGRLGALVIVGLGGYKLFAALTKGHHNVGFLLLMGLFALIFLAALCRSERLSPQGKEYLARLQQAFGRLKMMPLAPAAEGAASGGQEALLLVSVFGVGALAGSVYAPFAQIFHRASVSGGTGGGCGSSCGSSCSGGSSCGGSGCGGGGCGGCSS
jgi:uncharacterized protein (TIGR04222 family)